MDEKQLTFEILHNPINKLIHHYSFNLRNVLCQSSDKLNYNKKIDTQITSITFQAFKVPLTHTYKKVKSSSKYNPPQLLNS